MIGQETEDLTVKDKIAEAALLRQVEELNMNLAVQAEYKKYGLWLAGIAIALRFFFRK